MKQEIPFKGWRGEKTSQEGRMLLFGTVPLKPSWNYLGKLPGQSPLVIQLDRRDPRHAFPVAASTADLAAASSTIQSEAGPASPTLHTVFINESACKQVGKRRREMAGDSASFRAGKRREGREGRNEPAKEPGTCCWEKHRCVGMSRHKEKNIKSLAVQGQAIS